MVVLSFQTTHSHTLKCAAVVGLLFKPVHCTLPTVARRTQEPLLLTLPFQLTFKFHFVFFLPLLRSSLYDNAIQSLADTTFAPLVNIQTVHLGKNPLVCDCNLRWLARWIASFQDDASQEQEEEQLGVEKSDARCDSPKRVAGKRLAQLAEGKFKCRGGEEFRTKYVPKGVARRRASKKRFDSV